MTPQERLRFELSRIADEECYDGGSHQLMFLRQIEARELRTALDAKDARIKRLEEALRGCELVLARLDTLRHLCPEFHALDRARAALEDK